MYVCKSRVFSELFLSHRVGREILRYKEVFSIIFPPGSKLDDLKTTYSKLLSGYMLYPIIKDSRVEASMITLRKTLLLHTNLKLEVLPCYYWNLQELTAKKEKSVTLICHLQIALALNCESAKQICARL